MANKILNFFDRLEDRVRETLSHKSFLYAFIGGAAHVIFWRGVWHTSDFIMTGNWHLEEIRGFWGWLFYEPITIAWSAIVMILTGLFVATFIGERIIISGLKKEKKVTDRTEEEILREDQKISVLAEKLDSLNRQLGEIKNELAKK